MDRQQRRSRKKRQRTGKTLVLTQRDLAIFQLLERYRYLRSTFIHAFVGGRSATRFKERLGDLYHEGGYLDRARRQWESIHSCYRPVVYENTDLAREVLAAHDLSCPCVPGMPYGTSRGDRQFAHSLLICEVLASIELQTIGRADLRFVAWPEILAKAPDATRRSSHPLRLPLEHGGGLEGASIVPDGLFGIEYRNGREKSYRFFALELDRGTMPVRRGGLSGSCFAGKLDAYWTLIGSGAYRHSLGIPNLFVLSATVSERRMGSMMSALADNADMANAFLFGVVRNPVSLDGQGERGGSILWRRKDGSPFDILSHSGRGPAVHGP